MWSRTLHNVTPLYDIKISKRESSHNVVISANHGDCKTMALLRQNRSKNILSFKFLFHYALNLQIMWQSSASFTHISNKVIKDTNVSQMALFPENSPSGLGMKYSIKVSSAESYTTTPRCNIPINILFLLSTPYFLRTYIKYLHSTPNLVWHWVKKAVTLLNIALTL